MTTALKRLKMAVRTELSRLQSGKRRPSLRSRSRRTVNSKHLTDRGKDLEVLMSPVSGWFEYSSKKLDVSG
jgi:hypothetical protein